jgi:hypothetical protein
MRLIFVILAGGDLLLLCVTAVVGLLVQGQEHYFQHFVLGLLSALYTCFVHVVAFMTFVVSMRITQEAIAAGRTDGRLATELQVCKSRTLVMALIAIGWTLATAALGAIVTEPKQAAAWGVSTNWHFAAGMGMVPVNLVIFFREFQEIGRGVRLFDEAFDRGGGAARPGTQG